MKTIKMQKISLIKKAGTKTVWLTEKTENKEIDETQYNNIVNSSPFFRRLGGSEHHEKNYTCAGYLVTKIISTSPDRQKRSVYTFDFSC